MIVTINGKNCHLGDVPNKPITRLSIQHQPNPFHPLIKVADLLKWLEIILNKCTTNQLIYNGTFINIEDAKARLKQVENYARNSVKRR